MKTQKVFYMVIIPVILVLLTISFALSAIQPQNDEATRSDKDPGIESDISIGNDNEEDRVDVAKSGLRLQSEDTYIHTVDLTGEWVDYSDGSTSITFGQGKTFSNGSGAPGGTYQVGDGYVVLLGEDGYDVAFRFVEDASLGGYYLQEDRIDLPSKYVRREVYDLLPQSNPNPDAETEITEVPGTSHDEGKDSESLRIALSTVQQYLMKSEWVGDGSVCTSAVFDGYTASLYSTAGTEPEVWEYSISDASIEEGGYAFSITINDKHYSGFITLHGVYGDTGSDVKIKREDGSEFLSLESETFVELYSY